MTTNRSPLRVAFAGANAERAWAKDAHLPAVRGYDAIELYAVSARTQAGADAAAAAFGAEKAYDDSLAMVTDPAIDIVSVTVKVPEHKAIVMAAIAAGKHVYCEWPLGRDLAEAEEMAAAAKQAGVHAAIGLQGANSRAVQHAATLVRDGVIGRPLSLRVVSPTAGWGREAPPHYAYLQDKRNGATLATIAGGHTLAAIEEVVGAFTHVSAINSILHDQLTLTGTDEQVTRSCPDHMLIIGQHQSGCVSSLEVIGGDAKSVFEFELRGTKGTLRIEGHFVGGYQGGNLSVVTDLDIPPQPEPTSHGLIGPAANVAELYATLVNDIHANTRNAPDFDRAVRLTRLLDAIDHASDSGQRVAITH